MEIIKINQQNLTDINSDCSLTIRVVNNRHCANFEV